MKGDKEKIKQVFINLLHNAFDAIDQDGEIHVGTMAKTAAKEIRVSVRDTGCGINSRELQKIFEPFYTTKGPDKEQA